MFKKLFGRKAKQSIKQLKAERDKAAREAVSAVYKSKDIKTLSEELLDRLAKNNGAGDVRN